MKKIIIYIMAAVAVGSFASCKKDLESQFNNPAVYAKVENLYGGIFLKMLTENKVYSQDYGEFYWQFNAGTEVPGYAQIAQRHITDRYAWFLNFDDLSGTNAFGGNTNNLWNNRFNDFYTRARSWAVLKDELSKISGQALKDNMIYYTLSTVIKDYSALLTVDFYNSIPYSEAFKGTEGEFYPKFDDPLEIYKSVLDELKQISTDLPGIYDEMSSLSKNLFATNDLAMKGDVDKWVRYINALRLKYAVRISGVAEDVAKTHLQDVLTKPLPAADYVWDLTTDVAPESNGFWLRGLGENSFASFIPDIIMRRMHRDSSKAYTPGTDDPRLQVLAMPTKYFDGAYSSTVNKRKYIGVSYNTDAQKPAYVAGERYTTTPNSFILSLQQNAKSQYHLTTFTHNSNFPAYMMSMAEVDLLLAEVAAKNLGNTGKAASQHIKDAISHSTDFWYARNEESRMANSFRTKALNGGYFVGPATFATNRFGEDSALYMHPAKPSTADINKFSDSIATRFNSKDLEGKMEILMQQKYIHLNIMAPFELWSEIRRTRHPYLEPMTFTGKVMKPFPERLRYPTITLGTNPEEFLKVKDQDNFTTPIFWVPAAKRGVNPYWSDYNYE